MCLLRLALRPQLPPRSRPPPRPQRRPLLLLRQEEAADGETRPTPPLRCFGPTSPKALLPQLLEATRRRPIGRLWLAPRLARPEAIALVLLRATATLSAPAEATDPPKEETASATLFVPVEATDLREASAILSGLEEATDPQKEAETASASLTARAEATVLSAKETASGTRFVPAEATDPSAAEAIAELSAIREAGGEIGTEDAKRVRATFIARVKAAEETVIAPEEATAIAIATLPAVAVTCIVLAEVTGIERAVVGETTRAVKSAIVLRAPDRRAPRVLRVAADGRLRAKNEKVW